MKLIDRLLQLDVAFLDSAPVIYHIEAHPVFGPPMRELLDVVERGELRLVSSVLTVTEVLPKPVEMSRPDVVERFCEFLTDAPNLGLLEITSAIAERAGRLRGQYPWLRTLDALQLSAAEAGEAEAFITNDKALRRFPELEVVCLSDYVGVDTA